MSHFPLIIVAGKAGSGKDTVGSYLKSKFDAETIALADPMKRLAAQLFNFDEMQLWGPSSCRNEATGTNVVTLSFDGAYNLAKQFCEELGLDEKAARALVDWYEGQLTELASKKVIAPRTVLQTMGTEWGRAQDPNMWARYAIKTARKLLGGGHLYHKTRGATVENGFAADYVVITDGRFRNELLHVSAINGVSFRVVRPDQDSAEVGVKGHQSEKELDGIPRHFYTETIVNNGTIQDLYDKVDEAMAIHFGDDRTA